MHLQESGEMYLESIYILLQKDKHVRSIDVCEFMGFSKPSVSRAMSLLRQGGYVLTDKQGYLTLTELGTQVAEKVFERHQVLTKAFVQLGVNEDTAAADACKIEHVISDESFDAVKKHLGLL